MHKQQTRSETTEAGSAYLRIMLRVVTSNSSAESAANTPPRFDAEALDQHRALLESYLRSHRTRNHSDKTICKERAFLMGWFETHGTGFRPLYTWEAMAPRTGRERIAEYGQALIQSQLTSDTVRSYLGILRNYFAYVLEHPYVKTASGSIGLRELYGSMDQPVSEYDIPTHVYDGERHGVPFDPERLYEFYSVVLKNYLNIPGKAKAITARNYAALVLAGESGLRADELLHLEISDLHFDSFKVQTRYAKGTRGSGKRSRLTLFTPLARDTIKFYLNEHRSQINNAGQTTFLFPSKTGGLLDYASLQKGLVEMIETANRAGFVVLPHMSWHWMRRFFATRFIEHFPNKLASLIKLLGHMNPGTVHRYIRHSEAWVDNQIQEALRGHTQWLSLGD